MRRVACWRAPNLDELMALAVAFDQGNLPLDPYEVQELFNRLIACGQAKLSPSTALRQGTVSLERDHNGMSVLRLERRQMQVQLPVSETDEAA